MAPVPQPSPPSETQETEHPGVVGPMSKTQESASSGVADPMSKTQETEHPWSFRARLLRAGSVGARSTFLNFRQ